MTSPRLGDAPIALAEFFGLLMECPLHGGNPATCHLHHVRELPVHDRFEWAKGVAMDEARRIRTDCNACVGRQLEAWQRETPPQR